MCPQIIKRGAQRLSFAKLHKYWHLHIVIKEIEISQHTPLQTTRCLE